MLSPKPRHSEIILNCKKNELMQNGDLNICLQILEAEIASIGLSMSLLHTDVGFQFQVELIGQGMIPMHCWAWEALYVPCASLLLRWPPVAFHAASSVTRNPRRIFKSWLGQRDPKGQWFWSPGEAAALYLPNWGKSGDVTRDCVLNSGKERAQQSAAINGFYCFSQKKSQP